MDDDEKDEEDEDNKLMRKDENEDDSNGGDENGEGAEEATRFCGFCNKIHVHTRSILKRSV